MTEDIAFNFKTWGEMVQFCRTAKTEYDDQPSKVISNEKTKFTQTKSFPEAINMAVTGWPEMAQKASLQAKAHYSKISNLCPIENVNHGIHGHGIDVARFVEGIPECWLEFEPAIKAGKSTRVLQMIVNVSAAWHVDAKTLEMKGGYAFALLDLLELSGYRVGVKICTISHCPSLNRRITTTAIVKNPDQPPDRNRLAYILAHPSVLRRLMFSIWETVWDGNSNGHGRVQEYEPATGEIYIGEATVFKNKTAEDIERMLISELQKQGVIPKGRKP